MRKWAKGSERFLPDGEIPTKIIVEKLSKFKEMGLFFPTVPDRMTARMAGEFLWDAGSSHLMLMKPSPFFVSFIRKYGHANKETIFGKLYPIPFRFLTQAKIV